MIELKKLSKEGIPNAIEKAMRYRLLNEPEQSESICRDILETEPEHQQAIQILILAITDQFQQRVPDAFTKAKEMIDHLQSNYDQAYYMGIIFERYGKAALYSNSPHAKYICYEHLRTAMEYFEKADDIHPEEVEDPILRWNSCVRIIRKHDLKEKEEEDTLLMLE